MSILDFFRTKGAPPTPLAPVWPNSNWFGVISESFTGAWQRNIDVRLENVLTYSAVYSCISLIAGDIGKLRLYLVQMNEKTKIWTEVENSPLSPVLRKPNHYQTRQKFIERWIICKLIHGNAYILKKRDLREVVTDLYVIDPLRTKPLVTPSGDVFYQVSTDDLAGIDESNVVIPASEIIHDVGIALYHPLCGVSPITACGLAAMQGLAIQNNSAKFFQNGSNPGGVLTAPGEISDTTAKRLKDHWEQNYTGANVGKVAVLGDGLKYEAMMIKAVDAQLIDQLKWTAETVCSCFHVPAYMVGVGPPPSYNNIEALNQQYYSQCLQTLMESVENLLDEGLGLDDNPNKYLGTEFCLDDLLKMDTATQYKTFGDGIRAGLMAPNEARRKVNLPPVDGGDTPYMQQQNFSLAALDKRDTSEDPFKTNTPAPKPAAADQNPDETPPPPEPVKLLPPPEIKQLTYQELVENINEGIAA